ncbi:MAG: FAD-dependent oxidoreductase, partial [bacterium]|nr:FAD-dependent oxidoreductase [bacterium]
MKRTIKEEIHDVDFCVVGGGMAGICAAISAARNGVSVVLIHDRPVLGGNSSSECRVHICGADRHNRIKNMRETGVLEELRLENLSRNPNRSYSIWDLILYEKIKAEPSITLLLNCSCFDAEVRDNLIFSVSGWQTTTQTLHRVKAKIFADCSGDGILAPLTGAMFRMGREGRNEFNESHAPEQADSCTMGMSCLFMAKEYDSVQKFEPPSYAYRFDNCDDMPYGRNGHGWLEMGYWWIELGGQHHSISVSYTH